jgi:hypothetical protein
MHFVTLSSPYYHFNGKLPEPQLSAQVLQILGMSHARITSIIPLVFVSFNFAGRSIASMFVVFGVV